MTNSARLLALEVRGAGTARWALGTRAQWTHINLQLFHRAAEGVAVHRKLPSRLTLIAAILFKNRHDEALFELGYRFRIKNVALVHLQDESFQLIFH